LQGRLVFFLLKCAACIALVLFLLQSRDVEPPPGPASDSHARAAAPRPPRRPQFDESARELMQAGADALAEAARDRCLSAPRDGAAALQRLQGAGRER
jgi:hypothetical protein